LNLNIEWQIFCRVENIAVDLFRLLHHAGLSTVNIGIEGGSQTQLDRMNKRQTVEQIIRSVDIVRSLNIILIPSFIMFDPYVSLDEIEANINLINNLGFITYLSPNCIIPFSGTQLTKQLATDGLLDFLLPAIPDFLPNVNMANLEISKLHTAWMDWRPWVDSAFDELETKLVRFAYAYHNKANLQLATEYEYQLAQRLKSLEADYVFRCINLLRQGHTLNRLITLRDQFSDDILSISLAVPREYQ
jgi:hypothetical protein